MSILCTSFDTYLPLYLTTNYTVLTNSIADGILLLSPLFLTYSLTFFCFFKAIVFGDQKAFFTDRLHAYKSNSPLFYSCYIAVLNIAVLFFLFFIFFCKNSSFTLWSDHLVITNNNLLFIVFIFTLTTYLLIIFNNLHHQQINIYKDYFYSLVYIILTTPYLFIVNNFFSFIFVLEYINTIIFYKLISSKLDKNITYFGIDAFDENNLKSKKYVNIIFFQF